MKLEIKAGGEESKKGFDKYEIDDAVRCLMQAEEIKANPELMAEVAKKINVKKAQISKLSDLVAAKKGLKHEMDKSPGEKEGLKADPEEDASEGEMES